MHMYLIMSHIRITAAHVNVFNINLIALISTQIQAIRYVQFGKADNTSAESNI